MKKDQLLRNFELFPWFFGRILLCFPPILPIIRFDSYYLPIWICAALACCRSHWFPWKHIDSEGISSSREQYANVMKALQQCSYCSLQAIRLILLSVFTLSCVHVRLHVYASQASLCADNITVVGNHWELQSNTLLSMRRNKSQSSNKEQFIVFKCKHCSKEFDSSRAYRCHRTSPEAQGTPCSLEQNKSEITITPRSDLSTGVLRQRSLARLGALFKFCSIEKDK